MNKFTKQPSRMLKMMAVVSFLSFSSVSMFAYTEIIGAGTVADPYLISTPEALTEFCSYNNTTAGTGKVYKLANDIDMAGYEYNPNAMNFKATFDGQGYAITNLTISSNIAGVGFIGKAMTSAKIMNLALKNLSITASNTSVKLGAIVGHSSMGNVDITNCYVDGTVKSTQSEGTLGGLVGEFTNGALNIKKCCINLELEGTSVQAGFVGKKGKGILKIDESVYYGTGAVEAVVPEGGATCTNVYYDATNGLTSACNDAKSVTDLGDEASYEGFDFSADWGIFAGKAAQKDFGSNSSTPVGPATDTARIDYLYLGTVDNSNNLDSFVNTQTVSLQAPAGDSLGFDFGGWYADSALTIAVGEPAIGLGVVNDTVFFAKWVERITSNITYMNIGTVDNSNNVDTFTNVQEVTLQVPTGDSIGYEFAGWYADEDLLVPVGTPAIAKGVTEDTTFYAKWSEPFMVKSISYVNNEGGTPKQTLQNTQENIKICYQGSTTDSLYLLVSSEANWNNFWIKEKIGFSSEDTAFVMPLDIRAYATSLPANKFRVMLATSDNASWQQRYDIGSDGSWENDALFGAIVEAILGFSDVNVKSANVYPNPTDGVFVVDLEDDATMKFYDINGNMILLKLGQTGVNEIDLSLQPKGIYLLVVEGDDTFEIANVVLK